jgi:AAA+ superfamily predicted ATPase
MAVKNLMQYFGNRCEAYQDSVIRVYSDVELEEKAADDYETAFKRYVYLFDVLGSDTLVLAFQLAVAQYMCPSVGQMIEGITGRYITLQLASDMLRRTDKDIKMVSYDEYSRLTKLLAVENVSDNYMYTELKADTRLIMYLSGTDTVADELKGMVSLSLGQQDYVYYGNDRQTEQLSEYLQGVLLGNRSKYIQIAGRKGSGRKSLLRAAADMAEINFVMTDFKRLDTFSKGQDNIALVRREMLLYDAGLCIYNIESEKDSQLDKVIYTIEKYFSDTQGPIILSTLHDTQVLPTADLPFVKFVVDDENIDNRIAVWNGYSKQCGLMLDYRYYGAKYTFTPEQVCKIFAILKQKCTKESDRVHTEDIICAAGVDIVLMPERGSIVKDNARHTLSDIELPEHQKNTLMNICSYMKEYYKVYYEWNMQEKFSYGRGMTALFAGTPGTGKTMAAGCVANELGLPLYRVDLSQVVDKYIGETEKKLEAVFKYAQAANVVLFFDEADALFGKRSEVKDAKDKYANTEVAFILQRIEQYDGIVILATNLINNIDEAFMRRMKYVVEFQMPDRKIREKIWRGSFSDSIPQLNIDYEFLAEKIELSGGHIKNIVLNATFLAAKDNSPVMMKHIIYCVQNEFIKLGKSVTADYFEEYAYCLS